MQTALTYRTNRDLFSNYYLDEHLPETEEWDEISDEELREKREEIRGLWDREKGTVADRTESSLEEKFIRPMFRKLGIPFEVEETVQRGQRRPDYGFFPSEAAARNAFEQKKDGGDFYAEATAVADAKRWGRPLDTRGSGEHRRDFENPSYQIHVYLQEVDAAQWAVLTNGQKWRLYYGPTSHRLDSYYEVDLPTILEDGDLEDFKYFYLFFRQGAFLEDAGGDSFLDDVYDESNVFAQELGEDLQDNIYEAIKILSEGYLQYPDNDLDEEDLGLIHDSSLIYLYRLIFVLYAEAEGRDLLDTDNEIYEEQYSLNALKQEVAEELDSADPKYHDWQDNLSSRLDELFSLIDQGSKSRGIPEEDLYIPAYNGGLFRTDPDEDDSDEAQFLANHTVGDAYLARVVELLTRSQNGGGKIFVDYSSLDVRHLGSVYEGLLEYQLNVADEPLALDDGEYVSADEGKEAVVNEGEVYLTTGSGERKATGSYYTPEYVVEYIVDETLGPLVDDIREDLAGQSGFGDGGFAEEFAERIFELKVLDPAMGSGHFLTSAVDYLAREIIDAQEKQADQQGIETIDEEHDINWARRKVAQRCIYGVDLNPLATELAKVSLWLRTLAAEQPLAFLDHHLKTGNSLVGSDIEDVLSNGEGDTGAESGQLTLQQSFDRTRQQAIEHVMDRFQDLLSIDNETLEDAKEMEDMYDEVRGDPLYQHLLAMANVHTAEQFGLDVPGDAYERMARALKRDSWTKIEGQDWFKSAQAIADDERFFHWELEFPIAFYEQDGKRKENSGFDAIIGNPPYVRQEQLSQTKQYLSQKYETYHGMADLYVYFLEQTINLLSRFGELGIIISNKFMQANYGTNLREYILTNAKIRKVVDFGELPVFTDASTFPAILLLENDSETQEIETAKIKSLSFDNLATEVERISYQTPVEALDPDGWSLAKKEKAEIINKMQEIGVPLEEYVEEIDYGIKTGYNRAFIINDKKRTELIQEHPTSKEIIKPLLKGDDVRRYYVRDKNRYLIFTRRGININDYPAIKNYLADFREELEPKPAGYDSDKDGEWEGRKPGDYEWYEIQDAIDYWKAFESPKIIYPTIQKDPRFALDSEGYYANNKCFIIPDDDYYLLSLLNSKLLFEAMKLIVSVLGDENAGGRLQLQAVHLKNLPIYDTENTPPEIDLSTILGESRLDKILDDQNKRSNAGEADEVRVVLSSLAQDMSEYSRNFQNLNLNLIDYLGIPSEELPASMVGETLEDLEMPVAGVADTPLTKTSEDLDSLRVESVSFKDDGGRLVMAVDISYKPDEDDPRETDTWGRLVENEFETYDAMAFVGLSDEMETLVRNFVPMAVEEGGGFADFRQNATQTNSPLDRLKALSLPDIEGVRNGLEQYIKVKARADELEKKIEKTDQLIDEIVYDLYGLTDEEIELVEEAVQDD
jgi:type II restriction/modification system DNA methylase subunit YeeA